MSLTAAFNDDYPVEMVNSYVLTVQYDVAGYSQVLAYDFKARLPAEPNTLNKPARGLNP